MPSNPVATMESIPCEVLTRIFLLLKADQDRECIDYGYVTPSNPIAEGFTGVCQYFRNAARGCALLWTTIEEGTPLARVQAYCSLSGSAPLTVRVKFGKKWRTKPQRRWTMYSPFLQLLCITAVAGRVSQFIWAWNPQWNAQWSASQPAPSLQFLTLSIDHTVAFASPAVPPVFTQGEDNIQTIRLRGLAVHVFRPPLHRIATLHLDGTLPLPVPFSTFAELVKAPAGLKHLSVYGDAVEEWPKACSPLSTISLIPYLESLRIHSFARDTFQGILLNIHAPSLGSLALNEMHEDDILRLTHAETTNPSDFLKFKS